MQMKHRRPVCNLGGIRGEVGIKIVKVKVFMHEILKELIKNTVLKNEGLPPINLIHKHQESKGVSVTKFPSPKKYLPMDSHSHV